MSPDDRLVAALTVLQDQRPVGTLGALGFVFALIATVIFLDWLAVLLVRAEERWKLREEEAERQAARGRRAGD